MRKILMISLVLGALFSQNNISLEASSYDDLIPYGTIIEEQEATPMTTSTEYAIEEIGPTTSTQSYGNNESAKVVSDYVDPFKVENSSGTHIVNFNNESKYVIYSNGKIIEEGPIESTPSVNTLESSEEMFVVENGNVVTATEAKIITIGGAEEINFMYPTVEDAYNQTNGITISGGAEVGSYHETVEYSGNYYAVVTIGGLTSYMSLDDIQIIPSYINCNTSYYFAQDGYWYYAMAIDPLTSSEYVIMPIDYAPDWAKENTKYYSSDSYNFTTNEYASANSKTNYQNQAYFQNLSFRSTSAYSASQYQSFLKSLGKTNSVYYNSTQAFVDAQEEYGVNSLILFSMANHESAYGTSSFAKTCNNFFGRGAIDSDPAKACQEYGYPTPEDGIMAQAIFLNNEYADIYYWTYGGTYTGSKTGGINMYYASDSNWGNAIGSLAFQCDQYLGGYDSDYYKVIQVTSDTNVYKDSGLTNPVYAQGIYTPGVDPINPNSYVKYKIDCSTKQTEDSNDVVYTANVKPHLVVVDETSSAYKVQLEAPINQGNSGYETWSNAQKGSYPEYEGYNGAGNTSSANYVSNGYVNFANEYENMQGNQVWISKQNTQVIANNPIHDTQRVPMFLPCSVVTSTTYDQNGNKIVNSKATDGSKVCVTSYVGDTNKVSSIQETNYYSGNIESYNGIYYSYNSDGSVSVKTTKKYNENHILKSKMNTYFNSNGDVYQEESYSYNDSEKLYAKTIKKINSSGVVYNKINSAYNTAEVKYQDEYFSYDVNGKMYAKTLKKYNSSGVVINKTNSAYNTAGVKYKDEYYTYTDSGKLTAYTYKKYNSEGYVLNKTNRNYNNSGKVIYEEYYTYYDSNGLLDCKTEKYYNEQGKLYKKINKDYNNGVLINTDTYNY